MQPPERPWLWISSLVAVMALCVAGLSTQLSSGGNPLALWLFGGGTITVAIAVLTLLLWPGEPDDGSVSVPSRLIAAALPVAFAAPFWLLFFPHGIVALFGTLLTAGGIVIARHVGGTEAPPPPGGRLIAGLPPLYFFGLIALVGLWIGLFFAIDDAVPVRDINGRILFLERGTTYAKVRTVVTLLAVVGLVGARRFFVDSIVNVRSDFESLALAVGGLWLVGAALPVSVVLALPLAIFWRPFIESRRHHEHAAIGSDERRAGAANAMDIAQGFGRGRPDS